MDILIQEVIEMRRKQKQSENIGHIMIPKVISIGFFGGLIWSMVASFTAFFNFTTVSPKSFVLRSWLDAKWTDQWIGQFVSILIISIISILFALLYYLFGKKIQGVWVGIIVGIGIWFLFFGLFEPLFPNIPIFYQLNSDTVVTTLCICILYAVFISYSVSFSYAQQLHDEKTS